MEFVSFRHFETGKVLQVAFVSRPYGGTTAAFVALLDPINDNVLVVAQANWYIWDF